MSLPACHLQLQMLVLTPNLESQVALSKSDFQLQIWTLILDFRDVGKVGCSVYTPSRRTEIT